MPDFYKEMPEIEGSGFCISVLKSLGGVRSGYSNVEAVSWAEIAAYQDATGVRLSAWEAESVRILSESYAAQMIASRDQSCPPPYVPEMTPEMQKKHAKMLRQKMRGK